VQSVEHLDQAPPAARSDYNVGHGSHKSRAGPPYTSGQVSSLLFIKLVYRKVGTRVARFPVVSKDTTTLI